MKPCPSCKSTGYTMRTGTYVHEPSRDTPGGTMKFDNAVWRECTSCHAETPLPALQRRIDLLIRMRKFKKKSKVILPPTFGDLK